VLTIENINILNSKLAGTPEWQIGEMFLGSLSYVFVIHKRVDYWTIQSIPHSELTIKLARERVMGGYGYVMETGIIKQNYIARSIHSIEDMKTITDFTMCLDKHIRIVLR
jgi:hypothetical protein